MRVLGWLLGVLLCALIAGCGGDGGGDKASPQDADPRKAASAAATAFVEAVGRANGSEVCKTLTTNARASLKALARARAEQRCADVASAQLERHFEPEGVRKVERTDLDGDRGLVRIAGVPTTVGVAREDDGVWRAAPFRASAARAQIKLDTACSRHRLTFDRFPLPPVERVALVRWLRRGAAVERRFLGELEALRLTRALRPGRAAFARALEADAKTARAVARRLDGGEPLEDVFDDATKRFKTVQRTFSRAGRRLLADCGRSPNESAAATANAEAVGPLCRSAGRKVRRLFKAKTLDALVRDLGAGQKILSRVDRRLREELEPPPGLAAKQRQTLRALRDYRDAVGTLRAAARRLDVAAVNAAADRTTLLAGRTSSGFQALGLTSCVGL